MNSILPKETSSFLRPLFKKNFLLIVLTWISCAGLVQAQCSVSSLSVISDTTTFCHAPFTVSFTSSSVRDTTPVLLSTQTSVSSFQQPFTLNFPTQNNGCTYILEMDGTAGLWLGTNRADAYGKYNGSNNSPYGPPGLSTWFLSSQPISGIATYNPAHIYNLVYLGDGTTLRFGFFDNPYNDNSGLVTFKWYGIPCYQYDWDFGDGNTSTLIAPQHTYTNPGSYTVTLRITDLVSNCYVETTKIITSTTAPQITLGPDLNLCTGQTFTLDANAGNINYLWQDNSTSSTFTINGPGTYSVVASNACGLDSDSVIINFDSAPSFNLGPDTVLCSGSNLLLQPGIANVSYTWQNNSTATSFNVTTSGTYSLTLANQCGSASDAIQVDFLNAPQVSLGPDITKCVGESHVLNPGLTNVNYLWQDQSTTPTFTVTTNGLYSVNASNMCGSDRDSIFIDFLEAPSFTLGEDSRFCERESHTLTPLDLNTTTVNYSWQDGSTTESYTVSNPGNYSLTLSNQCGTSTDQITLSTFYCDCRLFTPNTFSPNNDGINDEFYAIVQCELVEFELRIYNRYGEQLFNSHDVHQAWDGNHNGKRAPMDTYSWVLIYRHTLPDGQEKNGITSGQLMLLQ